MKNRKILSLLLLAGCVLPLASCNKEAPKEEDTSSIDTTTSEGVEYDLMSATVNSRYSTFLANRKVSSEAVNGFKNNTATFVVGDDNAYNFKPSLTVVDKANPLIPIGDSSVWTKPFEITVSVKEGENFVEADKSLYSDLDNVECSIDFTDAAVGKTFKLHVVPTGTSKTLPAITDIELQVIDGYNAYNAFDLSYLDDTEEDTKVESGADHYYGWTSIREAKGIDKTYHPAAVVLQDEITLTDADLPENLFWTAEDAAKAGYPNITGSLYDWSALYMHTRDTKLTLEGNYFQIDYSGVSKIKLTPGATKPNSHSDFLFVTNGSVEVNNLNVTGNAKRATSDEETVNAGGLIFIKAEEHSTKVAMNNNIARQCFITVMTSTSKNDLGYVVSDIKDCKFSDNYNSFLYNWGGLMECENSDFSKTGGPIVIQDHVDVEESDPYESPDYSEIYGHAPTTTFDNCVLDNFVAGTEAWFIQFNANTVASDIKSSSDLYYATMGKTFVVDEKGAPTVMQTNPKASLFNFIVFNKSGQSEGLTLYPVCGTAKINDMTFNYAQPTGDNPNYKKLVEFQAEAEAAVAAYEGGDSGEALSALFTKWEFMPEEMTPEAIEAAIMAKAGELQSAAASESAMTHRLLREVNAGGAPVFDHGNVLGTYDGNNPYIQPITNAPTWGTASPVTDKMPVSSDFVTSSDKYSAIYYNGMMLVVELFNAMA